MPPVQTYAVNFANGNLHPMWNPKGWDDMKVSNLTPGKTERTQSAGGFHLGITRGLGEAGVSNIISLTPPRGALPLDSRLTLRVGFEIPFATGAGPYKEGTEETNAEPWAVALYVRALGATGGFPGKRRVIVTCQFNTDSVNAALHGVRLNIPSDIQPDKGSVLDHPLNYSRYRRKKGAPSSTRFFLEHSFCGWGHGTNAHIPGSASLTIRDPDGGERSDHRVYSSKTLVAVGGPGPASLNNAIESVGVALVTQTGVGHMSVLIRGFDVTLTTSADPVPEGLAPAPTPS